MFKVRIIEYFSIRIFFFFWLRWIFFSFIDKCIQINNIVSTKKVALCNNDSYCVSKIRHVCFFCCWHFDFFHTLLIERTRIFFSPSKEMSSCPPNQKCKKSNKFWFTSSKNILVFSFSFWFQYIQRREHKWRIYWGLELRVFLYSWLRSIMWLNCNTYPLGL